MLKAKKGGATQSRRYLDKDLIPVLDTLPIIEVKKSDVLIPIRRIEARAALCVARKCRAWLKEVFLYAIAIGYIESNPASDLDIVAVKEPPERHSPMLLLSELKDFLIALRDFRCAEYTKCAIRILLFTGVRTGELRHATREQFDLDAALWTIPADAVKQLRKVIRGKDGDKVPPYLVPLSRQAIQEIRRVYEITGNFPLLIPGRIDPRMPISDGTINITLKRLGYEGRLTGHGIRATISTALNELGYNEDWIEAKLSHASSGKTRKTCNHAEYVQQRRSMMQNWADYLDGLL
ncbi:tyrosine-type recombinase/integrase [Pseudomonas canadensis]|uniref:tyrosine-type recombinase/integrase n=1 Tax=Pseudomonas TaxID=286 RepID=UPI002113B772|nr:site-specific integrase [Pseudomonas sp. C 49-2]